MLAVTRAYAAIHEHGREVARVIGEEKASGSDTGEYSPLPEDGEGE